MAYTSDTTSFNPDLNEIFEEAFERCGQELRSGYDLRTAWTRPPWLDDPTAPDVLPSATWLPGVTVFQSFGDLVDAWYAPIGRGHNYEVDLIDAWAAVRAPEGWTDADTARLRAFLHDEPR